MEDFLYVNMDRKLIKTGGRTTVRILKEDFLEKIVEIHKENEDYIDDVGSEFDFNDFKEDDIAYYVMTDLSKVNKDISKIKFNDENNYVLSGDTPIIDDTVPNLIGIHTLENGLTFLGCMAGGDWECPIFFIVYWDGKSFRGYVPSYGNCYNIDFKSAFGSEDDYIEEDLLEILRKKKYSIEDVENERLSEVYMKRQGVKTDNKNSYPVVNWNAVKEDIKNRIVVK